MNCLAEDIQVSTTITIDVRNLATGQVMTYTAPGLTARKAVELAWRQSRGDFNTWDYGARRPAPIEEGPQVVICGDWCARKAVVRSQ